MFLAKITIVILFNVIPIIYTSNELLGFPTKTKIMFLAKITIVILFNVIPIIYTSNQLLGLPVESITPKTEDIFNVEVQM